MKALGKIAWTIVMVALLLVAPPHTDRLASAQTQAFGAVSQFAWFDRTGKRLATIGELADYGDMELSPDGRQLGVAVLDPAVGTRDIWLLDAATGARTRLTDNRADENWLAWSADGRRVIFNSSRRGTGLDLFQKASTSLGAEDVVLADGSLKWPVSWAADGRNLLYVTGSEKALQVQGRTIPGPDGAPLRRYDNDIFVLPLGGDPKPYAFLQTTAAEYWASFSPDGKWISYSATDADDPLSLSEVYVAQFPPTGRKWQISSGGGFQARWRRDGKEIFFLGPENKLMSATLSISGSNLQVTAVQTLFETRYAYPPYHAYDVSPDGQRILVNTRVTGTAGPATNARLFPNRLSDLTARLTN